MRSMRELNEVFDKGDHIEDDELNAMINAYSNALGTLDVTERTEYSLVMRDLRNKLDRLDSYRTSRRRRS